MSLVAFDGPAVRGFVVGCASHARIEFDVAAQLEAIGHVIEISQDLGLRCVPFRPFPLLIQLWRKRIRIVEAFHVAARAGIAIPIPGSADAAACFESRILRPVSREPIEHVESREAGTHDEHIEAPIAASCRAFGFVHWTSVEFLSGGRRRGALAELAEPYPGASFAISMGNAARLGGGVGGPLA